MRITGGEFGGRNLLVPKSDAIRPTQDRVREALFNILAPEIAGSDFLDLFAGSGAVGLEALSRGARAVTFVEQNRRHVDVLKRNLEMVKGAPNPLMQLQNLGRDALCPVRGPDRNLGRDALCPVRGPDRNLGRDGLCPVRGLDRNLGRDGLCPVRGPDRNLGRDALCPVRGPDRNLGRDGLCPVRGRDRARPSQTETEVLQRPALTTVVVADCYRWLSTYAGSGFTIAFADPPYALGEEKGYASVLATLATRGVIRPGGLFIAEMTAVQKAEETPGWNLLRDRTYGKTRLCIWRFLGNHQITCH